MFRLVTLLFFSRFVNAVTITANAGSRSGPVPNFASTLTEWSYESWSNRLPASQLAAYPFLETIELFTATGGCYLGFPGCTSDRDLLSSPSSPDSDYAFGPLLAALGNITASGLRPYIVTGNIPIAYSSPPFIGGFGFNSAPPANFSRYRSYISALASAAVDALSLDAVRGFRWGVFTEYNNVDWLLSNASTYFAIYDYTACALEGVLGAGHVDIGAHACTQCGGKSWASLSLLDHIASGANTCTGGTAHTMTFFSLSFYETEVGQPGDLSWISRDLLPAQAHAAALGLSGLRWGIDEGRLLQGVDKLPLAARAVGASYQASWDALFTKTLIANGFDYYCRWGVNTGGFAPATTQVDCVSTNVAALFWRMHGDARLPSMNETSGEAGAAAAAAAAAGPVVCCEALPLSMKEAAECGPNHVPGGALDAASSAFIDHAALQRSAMSADAARRRASSSPPTSAHAAARMCAFARQLCSERTVQPQPLSDAPARAPGSRAMPRR